MMTLREFLKVARHEHFRVYQPNRDCLIFESYFKVHSPYYFGKSNPKNIAGEFNYNSDYYDNNDYCHSDEFYIYEDDHTRHYDEETNYFLEEFGDYEVVGVECSGFKPYRHYRNDQGELCVEETKDKYRPHSDYLNCFNVFIIPQGSRPCDRCHHSDFIKGECVPDNLDIECKGCGYNTEKKKGVE